MTPAQSSRSRPTLVAAGLALLLVVSATGATQSLIGPPAPSPTDSDDDGEWEAPFEAEIAAVNMALTPDGDVVYYDGVEAANHSHDGDPGPHAHPQDHTFFTEDPQPSESRVYHPDEGVVTTPDNDPTADLFCSGTTVRPDGDLMTVGGTNYKQIDEQGWPLLGTQKVFSLPSEDDDETWTDAPADMGIRRWYPTVIETPDGGALAAAGIKNLSEPETQNVYMETYNASDDEWDRVTPTFKFHEASGISVEHQGQIRDAELAPANLPMYPRLFVVPNGTYEGQVLYPANGDLWAPFGERPDEALWGTHQAIDPETGNVTFAGASPFGPRHLGNAVPLMLEPDEGYDLDVLSLGGTLERTGAATDTAEVVSIEDDGSIESTPTDRMKHPRWHPNSVLLPSGDVLTVGGATFDNVLIYGQPNRPILEAELYDADDGTWETMEAMELPRAYHSTAVLLPSGEVLVGGHVPLPNPPRDYRENVPTQDQNVVTKFETFKPPYLQNSEATRPDIESVSGEPADPAQEEAVASVGFDEAFTVTVDGLEHGAESVVLVRPGATTHGVDADQRGVELEVTDSQVVSGGVELTLESPPDGNVAPPGNYMLFVNEDVPDDEPYPSKAEFVKVGPEIG